MNILGIYSDSVREQCIGELSRLDELNLTYDIRDSVFFSGLNEASINLLDAHTHFVVSINPDDKTSLWFTLVTAYALGANKPLFLTPPLPDGFILELFPSGNIVSYFRMEKEKYDFDEMIRTSKEELAKSGIAFNTHAFCEAVSDGALKAVELFLNAGFSPDARDKNGVPAISLAIRGGHRSIITLLLEKGVDINAVSEDRGNTPVMDAAAYGDDALIKQLAAAGADLNIKSKNGQTALVLALGQQNEQVISVLLDSGADPYVKDNLGMNAIQYAKLFGKDGLFGEITQQK